MAAKNRPAKLHHLLQCYCHVSAVGWSQTHRCGNTFWMDMPSFKDMCAEGETLSVADEKKKRI